MRERRAPQKRGTLVFGEMKTFFFFFFKRHKNDEARLAQSYVKRRLAMNDESAFDVSGFPASDGLIFFDGSRDSTCLVKNERGRRASRVISARARPAPPRSAGGRRDCPGCNRGWQDLRGGSRRFAELLVSSKKGCENPRCGRCVSIDPRAQMFLRLKLSACSSERVCSKETFRATFPHRYELQIK